MKIQMTAGSTSKDMAANSCTDRATPASQELQQLHTANRHVLWQVSIFHGRAERNLAISTLFPSLPTTLQDYLQEAPASQL